MPPAAPAAAAAQVVFPVHVLTFHTERWKKFAALVGVDPCTSCSLCEARCLFDAITTCLAAQVRSHGA